VKEAEAHVASAHGLRGGAAVERSLSFRPLRALFSVINEGTEKAEKLWEEFSGECCGIQERATIPGPSIQKAGLTLSLTS